MFLRSFFRAEPRNLTISAGQTSKNIGFRSEINNDTVSGNSVNYNFYAAGSAPNYFSGTVGVGTNDPSCALEVRSGLAAGERSTGIISRSLTTQSTNENKALRAQNNSDTDTFSVSFQGEGYFAGDIKVGNDPSNPKANISATNGAIESKHVVRCGFSPYEHQFYSAYEVDNKGNHNSYFAVADLNKSANGRITGYFADESLGSIGAPEAYGVRSDLTTSSANNYNFFAAGNAPNYFKVIFDPTKDRWHWSEQIHNWLSNWHWTGGRFNQTNNGSNLALHNATTSAGLSNPRFYYNLTDVNL